MTKLTLLKSKYKNNVLGGINIKTMQTTSLNNKELQKLLPDIEEFEPELFRNFITYWLMRKLNSFDSTNPLKEIRNLNPNIWLSLIESNHKFKSLYGEDVANTLIGIIEESES